LATRSNTDISGSRTWERETERFVRSIYSIILPPRPADRRAAIHSAGMRSNTFEADCMLTAMALAHTAGRRSTERWRRKVGSLSRIALLGFALTACTGPGGQDPDAEIPTVDASSYLTERCWFDHEGRFGAFVVLAQKNDLAVPWPISGRCLIEHDAGDLGFATLSQIGRVELIDKNGVLQRSFGTFVNNRTVNHLPGPSLVNRVFYLRARVTLVAVPGSPVYAPEEMLELSDTNMTFEQFLALNADERKALWRALRS